MDELITLRALGALLTYPRADLIAALPEIGDVLANSRLLPAAERERLAALVATMRAADLLDLEQAYVELFDRGRATSLHLFEHVHGESRDRGQAMVDLEEVYARAGFHLTARELPDYLPVVLEYLSCRSQVEAREMLGDCAHILRTIGEGLARRGSGYAAVFAAVLAVAQEPGLDWNRQSEAPLPERPVDADWAETPAFAPIDAGKGGGGPEIAVMRFVPRKL
jgi:nitrate reductase delta subunit